MALVGTPTKINISPDKGNRFKGKFHLPTIDFQGYVIVIKPGCHLIGTKLMIQEPPTDLLSNISNTVDGFF